LTEGGSMSSLQRERRSHQPNRSRDPRRS
jgi:hypothetical protein